MPDTIAALATAPGKAAVAVIRISGPATAAALSSLGVRTGWPRRARLASVRGREGEVIDRGLVIWFPGPASFTGEDSAELHLHGGRFVVEAVLTALIKAGARLAAAGEFTRRAFENGKLDLAEAEGIADLIDAECAAQARQAADQLRGALGERHKAWRERLTDILARLEALVDFPDEEIGVATEGVEARLSALAAEFTLALGDAERGLRIREGYRIAIAGPPNAGKSSLFNALLDREAAIVTPIPGTTRDVLEVGIDVEGYRVLLADTAGLRDTADEVEREGVRRARKWAGEADRRIWVVDAALAAAEWEGSLPEWRAGDLCILNKADQDPAPAAVRAARAAAERELTCLSISVLADGPAPVLSWIASDVVSAMSGADFPAITRRRHEAALGEALAAIERAGERLGTAELAAEDVRLAARALAGITGAIAPEDVLEKVFATFCIGK